MSNVLSDSNNLQDPRYIGHQCCPPLPLAALSDLVGNLINNASAVYEMGPVNVAMERQLIRWMAGLAGWKDNADGVFTHGGTIGNLTALLAARQAMTDYDIWTEGVRHDKRLAVLVSEQCHYSIKRAVAMMGLGEDAVYLIPTDDTYHITQRGLSLQFAKAISDGRRPFTLVANGCSTATGSYDDLEMAAAFCSNNKLWLHVDGAHGASVLLSPEYRHRLRGIERADSFVWDAHKMMMVSALATAVIFREGVHSYEAFSQNASYLFEAHARDEWYNYAHRTVECTKAMIGLKLYVPLKVYGTDLFKNHIETTHKLAESFADLLRLSDDFQLAVEPESNIVCFRFIPKDVSDLNSLQAELRCRVLQSEKFYIVQTMLKEGLWLRVTLIHPLTTLDDLKDLLNHIRELAIS
ncbi:aminotransferase class I/II-fold pyridoxal phosphate-dependent enzyme [bacterium]|nr:aminotransferase class I/II-fold pyridoxal phosphate-dependent enzyme [bacterium]